MGTTSLYDVLGVAPQSEAIVIQAAYKAMMMKYHPDLFQGDPVAAEHMAKELNNAIAILGDPQQRAHYDATLRKAQAPWLLNPSADEPYEQGRSAAAETAFGGHFGASTSFSDRNAMSFPPEQTGMRGFVGNILGWLRGASSGFWPVVLLAMVLSGAFLYQRLDPGSAESVLGRLTPAFGTESQQTASAPDASRPDALPPEVDETNIDRAALEARKILSGDGMAKTQRYSEACFAKINLSKSWQDADFCFGFDTAISVIDDGAAKRAGVLPHAYFRRTAVQKRFRAALIDVFRITEEIAMPRMDRIWNRSVAALEEIGENLSDSGIVAAPFRGEWADNRGECGAGSAKKVTITPVRIRIQRGGGRVTKVAPAGAANESIITIAGKGSKPDSMITLHLQSGGAGLMVASGQSGRRIYIRCP